MAPQMMKQANRLRFMQCCCLAIGMVTIGLLANTASAAQFDHQYKEYTALLESVVKLSDDDLQTRVDYQQLNDKQATLDKVLVPFSEVNEEQYKRWDSSQQLSYLINAYNLFTLKLINDNWDDFTANKASSIRDLGGFFTSPWEKKFFSLFGVKHTLDDIEHKMIREWFKEPRIHVALVCAAVSCPPLLNEAYTAPTLNAQLDKQMNAFLSDKSRNQVIFTKGQIRAELSSIFKWYKGDFEKGDGGFTSLYDLLLAYDDALLSDDSDSEKVRKLLIQGEYPITYKDYDWRLNDIANF
jgi:hypothetical protein